MKKITALLLGVSLLLSLAGCSSSPRDKVINYYNKNSAELKESIENYYTNDEVLYAPTDDVMIHEWDGRHSIVDYTYNMGAAVGKSSTYYGFYYSPEDVPVSYQDGTEKLESTSATEWEWYSLSGGTGYVQKLDKYWYYYEVTF